MKIEVALDKLNTLLPLAERQRNLKPEYRDKHRYILNELLSSGKALSDINASILKVLEKNDLIVLDESNTIVGAYPFSLRPTAHHVSHNNINIFAMCAFDAIAIAPVFNVKINVTSQCYVTQEQIEIKQDKKQLLSASPSEDIHIGIRWQSPGSCSADSLCMEMIFLKDAGIAKHWQGGNENFSIFPLDTAIDFATRYFKPLLGE